MNVVDSSGWLEYLADAPNADFFSAAILDTDKRLAPSIRMLEVFKRVYQQRDNNAALFAIALMRQGEIMDLDGELALAAAKLGG